MRIDPQTYRNGLALALVVAVFIGQLFVNDGEAEQPIKIIVPYGPGGTTDIFARAFAKVIPNYLPGEPPVIVVNKPGGSATIGVSALHRAKADGQTIALLPTGVLEVQPQLRRLPWSIDSFQTIIGLLEIPASLNVLTDAPYETFDDFIANSTQFDKAILYSTSGGFGSSTHIAMERVKRRLGLPMRWIPFEGEAASRGALLSGKIDVNFSSPTVHRGGELRPLLFLTEAKPSAKIYEPVPTIADIDPEYTAQFALGVIAPRATPSEKLEALHEAFKRALSDPEIQQLYNTFDLTPAYRSPEELEAVIRKNAALTEAVLIDLGFVE